VRAFKAGRQRLPEQGQRAGEARWKAVEQIAGGRKYVTPVIAQALIASSPRLRMDRRTKRLSDREFQVLKLIASGQRLSDKSPLRCP